MDWQRATGERRYGRCVAALVDGDLQVIAERALRLAPQDRRWLLAVDGVGASGKTTFTAALMKSITSRPVVVTHVDDFFNPAEIRHRMGRHSPAGFWLDTYNYQALISTVLGPLRSCSDNLYRTHSFDRATGQAVTPETVQAPHNAVVLVEGTFLHRDELVRFWDHSIYLHVPLAVASERMAVRDGLTTDAQRALLHRYTGAQRIYFDRAKPWQRADMVVDNTDFTCPVIIQPSAAAAAREAAE